VRRPPARWPIAARLLLSALLVVLLVLPLAGTLLAWNFRSAVLSGFDDRLGALLNVVVAGLAYQPAYDTLTMERSLGDPRFDRVYSGWYWQVHDPDGRSLTSRSLWDQRLPQLEGNGQVVAAVTGPQGQQLRLWQRRILLPNLSQPLTVSVAGDLAALEGEVARFQRLLIVSLSGLGLLLLALLALQIRWGLSPLRRLEQDLHAVENGEAENLGENLPRELARLAGAVNQVLQRDRTLIERGRTAAGNLAHALKTPVAVLRTLSERLPPEQQAPVQTELQRLDEAVRHHLARASSAGPVALGKGTEVSAALAPVVEALAVLAKRRGLVFEQQQTGLGRVRVDAQDLQELAGNLLENALHWANGRVQLNLQQTPQSLTLIVEDDGPGMSASDCEQALQRGTRLDESRPGSGLGLAIVRELAELYDGEVTLARSSLGGLEAQVVLPLA